MTPRQLRRAIQEGRWEATVSARKLPSPPPEHGAFSRRRMAVAIRCAWLFLTHGYDWHDIVNRVGVISEQFPGGKVTRQRVSQYTDKGTQFLLGRGVFREVKKKTAAR